MRYAIVDDNGKITFHDDHQDADAKGSGHEYTVDHMHGQIIVSAVQWYSPSGRFSVIMDEGSIDDEGLVALVHYAAEKYNRDRG